MLVNCTPSSSVFVKPVTFLSFTNGLPSSSITFNNADGAWQTAATGFPVFQKSPINFIESLSVTKSHIGP